MATQDTDKPRIGFIGLGYMGSRMAGRLLDAGYTLTIHNRDMAKTQPLAERGARTAPSPREVAATSDVTFLSVPDDAAVESVVFGADGVLAGVSAGATVIDLSSVSPETSRQVGQAVQEKGGQMLDAPVSGSTPQAEQGTLTVLVGGAAKTFAQCRPVLEHFGTVVHMGDSGAGATMKLVVNTLLGTQLQTLAEAVCLGIKGGLDKEQVLDVLSQTAHVTPGQKAKMENLRQEKYPPQFPLRLMFKDFGLVTDLARRLAVPMPVTAAAQQVLAIERAKDQEEDCSAVLRLMEELSGLTPLKVG